MKETARPGDPRSTHAYVGTYTGKGSEGIYRLRLDHASGALTLLGATAGVTNPSFLAVHPSGRYLYAVEETARFQGAESGSVCAFAIDPASGDLTLLGRRASGGAAPCHLVVDPTGRNVLVANYTGGSVAVLRVEKDGRLGATTAHIQHRGSSLDPRRQEAPHAHAIQLDPSGRFAFAADLGLDRILIYRFDPDKGSLEPHRVPFAAVEAGSGPRHFTFHPRGRHAYAINELRSTVTAFAYDPAAAVLRQVQTITTLPSEFTETNYTAELEVDSSGRFLYGSNRGHDSIAVFAIDRDSGTLTPVEHEPTRGKTPRHFAIDPSGRFLLAANQNSDTIAVFRRDPTTGRLETAGQEARIPTPVCVTFLPPGR